MHGVLLPPSLKKQRELIQWPIKYWSYTGQGLSRCDTLPSEILSQLNTLGQIEIVQIQFPRSLPISLLLLVRVNCFMLTAVDLDVINDIVGKKFNCGTSRVPRIRKLCHLKSTNFNIHRQMERRRRVVESGHRGNWLPPPVNNLSPTKRKRINCTRRPDAITVRTMKR